MYTGGRLTKLERYVSGALSYKTDYGYDVYGRLATVDYGNGYKEVYTLNAAGQLRVKELQLPWEGR